MREYKGAWAKIVTAIGVVASLYAILYICGLFQAFGIGLLAMPHRCFYFGFVLALAFFLYPATKRAPKDKLPWYDIILALLSLVPTWYIVFFWDTVTQHLGMGTGTTLEVWFGFLLMVLTLEAARRVIGLVFPLIALFFVIHPLICNYLPGILHGRGYTFERVAGWMYLYGDGMLSMPLAVAATIIVAFIIFAQFLNVTGAGKFFTDLAFSLLGQVRGGPAKGSVIASSLFGTLSGSAMANVATTGVFTIPLMKRVGYEPEFAGAVEAVSSNGGQLMPPVMGVVAFIMAEMLGMPYGSVITAALLPALLYYIGVFMQVDLRAARRGIRGLPRTELPNLKRTIRDGWSYILPLGVLVLLLVVFMYSAYKSAWWALVALIVVSSFRKGSRLNFSRIIEALNGASRLMCMVCVACVTAGIMIGSMGLTGVSVKLSSALLDISGGNLALLLILTAAASFLMGMGLTSIPCYLMVAILIAPALVEMGLLPIGAHLFAFWFALASFITPPVALVSYAAAAIAESKPMPTGFQSMRLGIITYIIPFMFVYKPELLLIGTPAQIALTFITSIVGVILLACGIEGYALRSANWTARALFMIGGILLIVPGWTTDIIGLALAAMPILWQVRARRADISSS